jgi:16S rRNA (cytosine967-C5)-methyltransferase
LTRTARGVALAAMAEIDRGARANVALPALLGASRLDRRDRALATELVYGACRMRRACDWMVGRHTRGRSLDATVTAALRLGAYQIGWTRIPAHAAVSATVAEVAGPGRSLVNAVLRKVAADADRGLLTWPDRATELSYPDWIVDLLNADLGPDRAAGALAVMNQPATVSVRPDGYTQDPASQMVVDHLAPLARGGRVLDMCAAPGGKATGLAASAGLVVAADVSASRLAVVAENASRTGAHRVGPAVADGLAPPWRPGSFDLVLVDAPCSGLGVLRRRPDARWRVRPDDLPRLSALAVRLLSSASRLVGPGGVVAYSVCTLSRAETAAVDREMARRHPELRPLPPPGPPWEAAGRGALLLPQAAGTDGMFLLVLRATVP